MLRNWNNPTVNLTHLAIVVMDCAVGLFDLKHHVIAGAIIVFCSGLSIVIFNIYFGLRTKRLAAFRAVLRAEIGRLEGLVGGPMITERDAYKLADLNLQKIAAACGASYSADHRPFCPVGNETYLGPWVRIVIGTDTFYIVAGHIIRTRPGNMQDTTCFYLNDQGRCPSAELIATALLLLKRDPSIFERWRARTGYYA